MPDPLDLTDLNPEFHTRINKFVAAAEAAGIATHFTSGYRDNALQGKLRANYEAKQAGQPLPYPEEGSGGVAAPAGGSYHNYGFATDVVANDGNQNRLIDFARAHPEFGVTALGAADPVHFQITAPSLAAARAQWGDGGGGSTVSANDNRQIFFDMLTKQAGLSSQQALGVLWSMGGESHQNLDTNALNPNDPGGAFGAAQWLGARRWPLEEIAKHRGVAATDPHLQAEYTLGELTGNLQGAQLQPGVLAALKAAKTPEEAAHIWTAQFERPGTDNSDARISNGRMYSSLDANGNLVLKPVGGAGSATASAGAGAGASSPNALLYPQQTPMQSLGSMLGQAFTSMGGGGGGGGGSAPTPVPEDQPAIRSLATMTDFTQPASPLPAQYSGGGSGAGGLGSQLGSLSAQPVMNPLENPVGAPSITAGAPSMTSLLTPLGTNSTVGMWDQRGGSAITPNPYRPTMRLG